MARPYARKLEPLAIGWLADLLQELETVVVERPPTDEFIRDRLRSDLADLRDAINGWIRLLESQAQGDDTREAVWTAVRNLTRNLPAKLESRLEPRPAGATSLPLVARDSVPGRILHARMSRSLESDPFRDAVVALDDANPAHVTQLATEGRRNANRAIDSIDACLGSLASQST